MRTLLLAAVILLSISTAGWAGVIEVPRANSIQSGVSVFSGWKCTATILTVQFDGGQPIVVPYGSERNDTAGLCGDTDNGFALQINYGILSPGVHEAVIFDNSQEFARVTFVVVSSGVEFLTGVSGSGTLTLSNGQDVSIAWSQAQQGLVVTGFSPSPAPPDSAAPPSQTVCTTSTAPVFDVGSLAASWTVVNPCDGRTLTLRITPLEDDGFFACSVSLDFVQGGVQFEGALVKWLDTDTREDVCDDVLSGITKQTSIDISAANLSLDFSKPFQIYYEGQLAFDFQ